MKAATRIMYQRLEAFKLSGELTYAVNNLNQYTGITRGEETPFVPTYDANGNQTLVKTATGIWTVQYDANNRPVSFTRSEAETTTVVECGYDYLGRRYMKKVTVNGTVTLRHRYLYRGYLQIACCDLTRAAHPCLWLIIWDPSEPVATRPLAIQKDGTWYCYGLDITKNVWELFGSSGYIRTAYDYTPYGGVTEDGDVTQPVQWSSEVYDEEPALVYYNYRHYNPMDGRWINRDPIAEQGGWNLYAFVRNSPQDKYDGLGLVNAYSMGAALSDAGITPAQIWDFVSGNEWSGEFSMPFPGPWASVCDIFISGTIHQQSKKTPCCSDIDVSLGVSCSLRTIMTKLTDKFRWKRVRDFIHDMIPKLAYFSLFGEFNGTWCGPNPLKVTWSLFSIHGELGIGDSRHGGIKRPVGYPSGLYIAGEFQWNLNNGTYAGGDIVAGINGNIGWFHFTNETSLLEIFGIK